MYYAIVNGPNLNLLGRRQPEIYGHASFEDTLAELRSDFADTDITYFQSNSEGELIDHIQHTGFDPECGGIILNPGAYAHYSIAIADAIEAIPADSQEVEDAPALYYNLSGIRVDAPSEPGVYIMRRGSQSQKILISK